MNGIAMNIGCSTLVIRHLRQRFKQQGVRKIDHVVDVRAKTAIFGTPTWAVASKLPQLLLLTPMVHITIVYPPKMCEIACQRVGQVHVVHVLVVFWRDATA